MAPDFLTAGAFLAGSAIFAGAKIYLTRIELKQERLLSLQQRQRPIDQSNLNDYLDNSPLQPPEPPEPPLPKPDRKCRHCGDSVAIYRDRDDYGKLISERHLPIMKMVDEKKGCNIKQPHIHMKCRLCGAEYPVQR